MFFNELISTIFISMLITILIIFFILFTNVTTSILISFAFVFISTLIFIIWYKSREDTYYILASLKPGKSKDLLSRDILGSTNKVTLYRDGNQIEAENLAQNIRACLTS